MPIQITLYTIEEAAPMVRMKVVSLASYCSRLKIGEKYGRSRLLRPADIERINSRSMGRPKKNSQIVS